MKQEITGFVSDIAIFVLKRDVNSQLTQMIGWQWHQLDRMQIICTLLQTDNISSLIRLDAPNQQCQSNEGNYWHP